MVAEVFVVNCLQFFIFTRFFAVQNLILDQAVKLWIAYNFLSLQGSLQSCNRTIPTLFVVNCLQFFIFTRFFAVSLRISIPAFMLWIAYNFLSLQGSLQYTEKMYFDYNRCELLTIFYLYKVLCSCYVVHNWSLPVVNCLQFFIFTRFFAVYRSWN